MATVPFSVYYGIMEEGSDAGSTTGSTTATATKKNALAKYKYRIGPAVNPAKNSLINRAKGKHTIAISINQERLGCLRYINQIDPANTTLPNSAKTGEPLLGGSGKKKAKAIKRPSKLVKE